MVVRDPRFPGRISHAPPPLDDDHLEAAGAQASRGTSAANKVGEQTPSQAGIQPSQQAGSQTAHVANPPASPPSSGRLVFGDRRKFYWKVAILLVTTVALVPIMLYKDQLWSGIYLVFLAIVHVGGIVVIVVGTKRHQIAPTRSGLLWRLAALAVILALLGLLASGVNTSVASFTFWGSLFAIWALHTGGLAILHIKGQRENALCPFV